MKTGEHDPDKGFWLMFHRFCYDGMGFSLVWMFSFYFFFWSFALTHHVDVEDEVFTVIWFDFTWYFELYKMYNSLDFEQRFPLDHLHSQNQTLAVVESDLNVWSPRRIFGSPSWVLTQIKTTNLELCRLSLHFPPHFISFWYLILGRGRCWVATHLAAYNTCSKSWEVASFSTPFRYKVCV